MTLSRKILSAAFAAALFAPALASAQVQNPTTLSPGSPQNQCVPTHKRDAASQTAGSPIETTVQNGIGSVPCQYNTPRQTHHRHRRHHHHRRASVRPAASPAPNR